jgi:hypothetical protein
MMENQIIFPISLLLTLDMMAQRWTETLDLNRVKFPTFNGIGAQSLKLS